MISSVNDQSLRAWDMTTTKLKYQVTSLGAPRKVVYSPDGKTTLVGSYHGTPTILDPETGKVVRKLPGTRGLVD
jgi:WD40 repeat protein